MPKSGTSAKTIVVLHGWTMDPSVSKKWQPMMALLKRAGFSVKFWPLPGLTVEVKKPLQITDYVAWLSDKLKNTGPVILLGHSFGGQLAIRFAKTYPKKVAKLILVDSSGILDPSWPKTIKRFVFKVLAKTGKAITQSEQLRYWLYRLTRETDYYQANPVQRQTMRNMLQADVTHDLPAVKTPTLIIWGEKDRMTPLTIGRIMASKLPNAKLRVILGARHSPVYTHTKEVLKLVKDFLKA